MLEVQKIQNTLPVHNNYINLCITITTSTGLLSICVKKTTEDKIKLTLR